MKRGVLAVLLAIVLGVGAYLWYRSRPGLAKAAIRRHQEGLVRLLQSLPERERTTVMSSLSRSAPDWRQQLDAFQSGRNRELSQAMQLGIQVAVQPQLRPVPIVNGRLQPVLPQLSLPQAPALTPDRQDLILQYAGSVGRLEVKNGSTYALKGTAFVVAPGLVATNCHVVHQFARPGPEQGARFVLAPDDLRIDFGDTPVHDETREFRITSLKPCPGEGLDVAFLQTATGSVAGLRTLPAPLPLTSSMPGSLAAGQELNVAEIGYPDLTDRDLVGGTLTQDLFKRFDPKMHAKFYSPGAITSVRSQSGIDFVYHVVSTWSGESGSPLVDLDARRVVAVDSCCDRFSGALPGPSDLSCATRLLTSPANLAVSGWTVANDPILGVMLPRP